MNSSKNPSNLPPGWLEILFQNPPLFLEYKDYLVSLLNKEREKQDETDDLAIFAKSRGAIKILREQILFVENWQASRSR